MNCFHVIPKIINGTGSERTLIALNIFFMHPGHMPFKVIVTFNTLNSLPTIMGNIDVSVKAVSVQTEESHSPQE